MSHPNIVGYYGSEIFNKCLFIYLEYVSGGSLKYLINKIGGLNESLIKKYSLQIIKGLNYLHCKRIVHRDVKCANILVTSEGIIKLSDFGVASSINCLNDSTAEVNLLKSLKGTVPWMAPEVINQKYYGKKTDVWSFGCTLIEMATGENPWASCKDENFVQIMLKIGTSEELPDIPKNVSSELREVILACLERNPLKRIKLSDLKNMKFLVNKF